MIIVRSLYRLNISGGACRSILAQTLPDLGYQATRADPGIWIKLINIPDGREYYALVIIYVDELLHIHHYTNNYMNKIRNIYRLNNGVVETDQYLGANIHKVQLYD